MFLVEALTNFAPASLASEWLFLLNFQTYTNKPSLHSTKPAKGRCWSVADSRGARFPTCERLSRKPLWYPVINR